MEREKGVVNLRISRRRKKGWKIGGENFPRDERTEKLFQSSGPGFLEPRECSVEESTYLRVI
jgi:hypothetical protein